jgi:hypothetical protein
MSVPEQDTDRISPRADILADLYAVCVKHDIWFTIHHDSIVAVSGRNGMYQRNLNSRIVPPKDYTPSVESDSDQELVDSLTHQLAALESALHGYWKGEAVVDGRHHPLLARALEVHQAWEGLYHTTVAAEKILERYRELRTITQGEDA